MSHALALLLADGRWPGGGYAHSGGLEAAVAAGTVHDAVTLSAFVEGRLHTAGPLEAWIAGRACAGVDHAALSARYDARTPSPAQRQASMTLGRGLLRSSARIWPELRALKIAHQPLAVGAVARAAGLLPADAAGLALHSLVMGPLTSAPKLFAIDTSDALRIAVTLSPLVDSLATSWGTSDDPPPALSALSAELLAEEHATWSTRLFAS